MAIAESPLIAPMPTPWRRALPGLGLVLAAILLAYRGTAESMVAIWSRSDTFAHAFLVPPIALWLIWRQRDTLASMQPRANAWMLLPMALAALLWLFGDAAALNSVTQLAMVALLVLAVPALLGLEVARAILFPLLFIFFSVPIGEFLLPQLMAWTADFTALALRASGIPVFREGMQIVIPSGHWSVVEACSGVRYLIASFMVGTLFAHLHYRSPARRWAFVGLSIAVPVVANWMRAYLIVLLGHLSDNKLAVGADHLVYGWVFFGLVMAAMFAIGMVWSEADSSVSRVARPAIAAKLPAQRTPGAWGVAACAVLLMLLPPLGAKLTAEEGEPAALALTPPATLAAGWQAMPGAFTNWKPAYRDPSAALNTSYQHEGRQVGLYIGYYRDQRYDRKLLSSNNQLVMSTDKVWAQIDASAHTASIDGEPLTVQAATLRSTTASGMTDQQLLAWRLYWAGGRLTDSQAWVTLHGAADRLAGRGDDAAAIVLYTPLEQPGGATAALQSFAQANLALIVARLQEARSGLPASIAAHQSKRDRGTP